MEITARKFDNPLSLQFIFWCYHALTPHPTRIVMSKARMVELGKLLMDDVKDVGSITVSGIPIFPLDGYDDNYVSLMDDFNPEKSRKVPILYGTEALKFISRGLK